jgi:UDP-GlcNAc:undecaprenyl-phosphate/decaprenyl-phosphate GlcNAc-1-phosphate transferase
VKGFGVVDYRVWISAAASFVITVAALLALRPLAYAVDLVDRPGGRKTHHGVVPVVGGLGMLLGLVFGVASHGATMGSLQPYLFSAVLLAVVGMLDDRFSLSPRLRLLAQFAAVMPMFFVASIRLTSFGDLLGIGSLDVRAIGLLTTAFVTIAAINAFNMLDGLDGLAGGIVLVAALMTLALPGIAAHADTVRLLVVLCGSIVGFLLFNLPVHWNRPLRCFMGDAGSTLLGFTLAWVMIEASQGTARAAAPITMVWLVAVPATDLVSTVIRRLWRRQSPLRPDNEHLHHMLLRGGLGVRAIFAVMIALAIVGGMVGLILERAHVPDWASFALLVAGGVVLTAVGRNAKAIVDVMPESLHRRERRAQRVGNTDLR